jgi:hypothetical protein
LIVLGVGDVGWLGFGFDENLGDVEREREQKGCFEAMFHIPQRRPVIIVSSSCGGRVLQYAFFLGAASDPLSSALDGWVGWRPLNDLRCPTLMTTASGLWDVEDRNPQIVPRV